MEINQRLAAQVGAALSVLLIAAVVIALRVDFSDLGPAIRVRVYMKHPGPLRASADVQLAGRKIGRVDSVHLVTAKQANDPSHLLYPDGGVVLSVLFRKKYLPWVRQNSALFVNSKGLIGESYLEVAPPPASEDMQRPLREGDKLRGIDPARMEEIIVTSFLNAKRFGALLAELRPSMSQLRADLSALSATLDALAPSEATTPLGPALARAQDEFQSLRATLASSAEGNLPTIAALHTQSQRLASHARTEFTAASTALNELTTRLQLVQGRMPPDSLEQV